MTRNDSQIGGKIKGTEIIYGWIRIRVFLHRGEFIVFILAEIIHNFASWTENGSYMGVIMSEVLYQAPKKDYFCEAKPSNGKIDCP